MEFYTPTEKDRATAIEQMKTAVRNFPPESERKANIFKSFNDILENLGCYLNDTKCKLELVKEADTGKEQVRYSSVYGCYVQDVTNDSVKTFFEDTLKLLLAHCKELNGCKNSIDTYFQNLEEK